MPPLKLRVHHFTYTSNALNVDNSRHMRVLKCLWPPRAICVAKTLRRAVSAPLHKSRCGDLVAARGFACSHHFAEQRRDDEIPIRKILPRDLASPHHAAEQRRNDHGFVRKNQSGQPEGRFGEPGTNRSTPLDTRPLVEFERRVEQDTATVEDAARCLKGLRGEIEARPFPKRRQACIDTRAGGRVLAWLLRKRDELSPEIYRDRTFSASLMWFAIGQGVEEIVWDWIRIEIGQGHQYLVMKILGSLGEY